MSGATALPSAGSRYKRGARAAFRRWLNEQGYSEWRNGRYQQRTRPYGDYLYAQDREMFDDQFAQAMKGKVEGFDPAPWVLK